MGEGKGELFVTSKLGLSTFEQREKEREREVKGKKVEHVLHFNWFEREQLRGTGMPHFPGLS